MTMALHDFTTLIIIAIIFYCAFLPGGGDARMPQSNKFHKQLQKWAYKAMHMSSRFHE